jgi:CBS domain-containing protein
LQSAIQNQQSEISNQQFEIESDEMTCPSCGHENIEGMDRCDNCMTSLQKLDVPQAGAADVLAHSVMEDNLNRLDQEETIKVRPDTPVFEVVARMKAARSGCALVLDEDKLVGIFTEHDVLHRMFGDAASSRNTTVAELMTRDPETLRDTDSVATALNKMSLGRYRHLPVARQDGGYSVTSITSVLKYLAKKDW